MEFGQIGYYQLHLDEIIEKYCINKEKPELQCNGKCFLQEQLEQSSNIIEKKSERIFNLSDTFLPAYYQEIISYTFELPIKGSKELNWKTIRLSNSLYSSGIDRPPSRIA